MKKDKSTRRDFLRIAVTGAAALGMGLRNVKGEKIEQFGSVTPWRPSGQSSVMGLVCKPIEKVRIGIIGLGMRGMEAVRRLQYVEGVEITAVCDVLPDRVMAAQKAVSEKGHPVPEGFSEDSLAWMKLCESENVDLVYACTPWDLHTPNAVHAMNNGKHAAIEVPAAMTLDDCWLLVDTAEKTQRHCMMLENCCYDFFELATLNMARQGIFGEIMHAECAYIHDLRWLKFDKENGYADMWRLKYSMGHNGNLYPTHGLGPVAQIMGINRGDRMEYLTSTSTSQVGMSLYAKNTFGEGSPEFNQRYSLGDMNTTMVCTARGKTIMIQHDTTSPRPYSRIHMISGTNGIAMKWPAEQIALEPNAHQWLPDEARDELLTRYEHPLARKMGEMAREVGGHGGMDYIMDWRLIQCLRNGWPLDQDVYDAAAWSSIVELSEISVNDRSRPVEIPDFTRGAWEEAKPLGIVE
ncbi:MAG TPA: Gfo/Idh/MocA family oxidoreductase [Bacteroidales bacterium]|nr:Gfo/Idh/MocA family oxidoreductase [Bacteroidales bacterium]HPM93249.1 Gfo/Idh/MocA family oxidoreductase [Bacteroidales bacterium]